MKLAHFNAFQHSTLTPINSTHVHVYKYIYYIIYVFINVELYSTYWNLVLPTKRLSLYHWNIQLFPTTLRHLHQHQLPAIQVNEGHLVGLDPWHLDMGVSKNRGTPKSSILSGFSIINHPFWGTPIFGNTHMFVVSCWFWECAWTVNYFENEIILELYIQVTLWS